MRTLSLIATIANNPAAPTFDNTVVALERSGESLVRRGLDQPGK